MQVRVLAPGAWLGGQLEFGGACRGMQTCTPRYSYQPTDQAPCRVLEGCDLLGHGTALHVAVIVLTGSQGVDESFSEQ